MLCDMNAAAGRRYQLMEQIGISPLRFNGEALEAALIFRSHPNIDVHVSGFIPMAGVTCPLDPRAAAVQAAAEELALDVLCTVLDLDGGGLTDSPGAFRLSVLADRLWLAGVVSLSRAGAAD